MTKSTNPSGVIINGDNPGSIANGNGNQIITVNNIISPEALEASMYISNNIQMKNDLVKHIHDSLGKCITITLKLGRSAINKTIDSIEDILQEIDNYFSDRILVNVTITPPGVIFTFSF